MCDKLIHRLVSGNVFFTPLPLYFCILCAHAFKFCIKTVTTVEFFYYLKHTIPWYIQNYLHWWRRVTETILKHLKL